MKEILKDIFTRPYQGKSFILDSLLKPLLGDYKPSNEDILHNSERKKLAENANVKAITRIAEFELEDTTLQVFDITLSSHSKIKYSKVNIQKVVRSIMDVYTGAIMFFHYENNEGDWRISFVEKEDSQKNTTSAKRYTFLVGENHPATTITQRFVTLRGKEKSVEAIRDAFSVEALSEEFFAKYKSHYEDFVQYISGKRFVKEKGKWVEKSIGQPSEEYISIFEENDKSVRDFVKKLLGRIVFLHFLQKKKWLCDDENYLQNLFKKSEKSNYLESVLEPLFFGVLNTKSEDRKVLFENENWDLSLLKEWGNIPYLNGGLFEKDELDKKTVIFPEGIFSDLFDFFSQYNFTIDENDPNDSEVGIDPEMLGKIFENLLEDNKDKGAFYTPKEIVQYMCRESLIAYLCEKHKDDEENIRNLVEHHIANWNEDKRNKILDSLKNVKICDPAIGSGAFPMGLLNELYQCRLALGEEKSVNIKKEIIQNNIYGVDIEKGAVDIARLRFWLTLVVEEETAEPLPNLDYKIMQGNSLLESYQGVDLSNLIKRKKDITQETQINIFDELLDVSRFELLEYIKEYFNCTNSDRKEELRQKIDENIRQQIEEERISLDLSNINLSANSHFFLWHTYFGNVFNQVNKTDNGFDIVIGNPPYISTKEISEEYKEELKKNFGFADDTYNHFFFKGSELLKEGGVISYITPKTFWTTQTKRNLRDLILSKQINYIFDTANPFESAMVDTCITSFLKIENQNKEIRFLDGSKDLKKPIEYEVSQQIFIDTQNSVIFKPTPYNLKIHSIYGKKVKELYEKWWDKISTSKNITKNEKELEEYRNSLKAGDIALLGCLTEGGQGLATANNGKYIAVRKSTKWVDNILKSRPKKLAEAVSKKNIKDERLPQNGNYVEFLNNLSEKEIAMLFDELKEKYGRDIFGQGYIYKLIDDSEIADVDTLTQDEKENGIDTSKKYYVPYDKGDKDGNRWYLETPFAIAWSKENVGFLKTNSGKKGQGMPVVRNPQFYFKEGFCWTDVNSTYLKARLKKNGVFDVLSMSLFTLCPDIPDWYFVCLINSSFISCYVDDFINNTSHFQINDARQLPIIIPNKTTLDKFEKLFKQAVQIKKGYSNEVELDNIQQEIDILVNELYAI